MRTAIDGVSDGVTGLDAEDDYHAKSFASRSFLPGCRGVGLQ